MTAGPHYIGRLVETAGVIFWKFVGYVGRQMEVEAGRHAGTGRGWKTKGQPRLPITIIIGGFSYPTASFFLLSWR